MKRRRTIPPEKRQQLRLDMRRRVAATVPEHVQEAFWGLLGQSDDLITRGWQLRRDAWALRQSKPSSTETRP